MIPYALLDKLAALRRRERFLRLTWGLARFLALALFLLIAACLIDWYIDRTRETPWPLRVTMLSIQVAVWVLAGYFLLVHPLFRRLEDNRLALLVESYHEVFGHRLISAVQLNRPGAWTRGMSPAMIQKMTHEAELLSKRVDFRQVADTRRLAWAPAVLVPVLLVAGALILWRPNVAGALFARQFLADVEVPRLVHLRAVVLTPDKSLQDAPAQLHHLAREEIEVRIFAMGVPIMMDRPQGKLVAQPSEGADETYDLKWEKSERDGDLYVARIPAPQANFKYRATLMDGRTRQEHEIILEARPVPSVSAYLILPENLNRRPDGSAYELLQKDGSVAGPPGSKVRIVVKAQKELSEAVLELFGAKKSDGSIDSKRMKMTLRNDKWAAAQEFELGTETERFPYTAYRVWLKDLYQFANLDPIPFDIRQTEDQLPRVRLLPDRYPLKFNSSALGEPIAEDMPVAYHDKPFPITFECSDDYGLSHAKLRYRVLKKDAIDMGADDERNFQTYNLTEEPAFSNGPFVPELGTFINWDMNRAVPFHAIPSPDPEKLGRLQGGGRYLFRPRIPDLKPGDQLEFYVEVYDRRNEARPPGRSQPKIREVVDDSLASWLKEKFEQKRKISALENTQTQVTKPLGSEPK